MLSELIKKLNELLVQVPGLIDEYNQKRHELLEYQKSLDERAKALGVQKQEQEAREKAITEQESLLLSRSQLEQMHSEVKDKQSEHQLSIESHQKYVSDKDKEIQDSLARIQILDEKLKQAQSDLDKEKREYKQKVIEQVNQEIKVKVS